MTLRQNFPEPVLPGTSSQDLPPGYAGNGPPTGSWAVFKEAWMKASIDSHIFETSTPISTARCCTRLTEFHDSTSSAMFALPSDVVRSRLVHSEAEWRFVLPHLSRYAVPPSQLLAQWFPCATKTKPPTPRSVSATRNLILATGSSNLCFRQRESEINAVEQGVDLNGRLRIRRQGALGAFTLCPETNRLVPGIHVQDPVRVDVKSDLRQATWRWRDPIEMELPKRIVVPSHRTLPFEDLDENTRLVVSVRRERLSLLRGKGSVAFEELHHDICSLQTH